MKRLRCLVRWHKWAYFIDGNVCRSCQWCGAVQYDCEDETVSFIRRLRQHGREQWPS